MKLTAEIIGAATLDAGTASMRKAGRTRWNQDDANAAAIESNRLWDIYDGITTCYRGCGRIATHEVTLYDNDTDKVVWVYALCKLHVPSVLMGHNDQTYARFVEIAA
jgi:hypothetical protein